MIFKYPLWNVLHTRPEMGFLTKVIKLDNYFYQLLNKHILISLTNWLVKNPCCKPWKESVQQICSSVHCNKTSGSQAFKISILI